MLPTFASWFSLAMYEDEEDRRIARIQSILIVASWLSSLIVMLMDLIWGDKSLTLFLILGGVSQLFAFYLLLRGKLSASNFLSMGLYIILITVFATFGQGIHDYVIMTYPAIIMFSGLVAQRRGLFMSVFLSSVSLAWLVFGELEGWFTPHNTFIPQWTDFIATELLILITALAVYMLVANLEHGLAQTWRELAERKRTEDALRENREMYRLLAENISDVIWIFDVDEKRARYISPSMERLRGYTPDEVMANGMFDAINPNLVESVREKIFSRIAAFRNGYRGVYVDELEQPCKDGSTIWVEATTSFHINDANGHLEMYGVSRNISERKRNQKLLQDANEQLHIRVAEIERLQAELREQAIRDSLTGLYNRRYMGDVFAREFSRAARENYSLSVIMLDMDDLKLINDNYGHSIGDQTIQAFAACLRSMTRLEDVVCRYGGDEFIVVIGKATSEDAFRRVEEWRQFLGHHPLKVDAEREVQIKFTAGIASFPKHAASMEEIVNYADIALYRAKARGRNCTMIFE